MNRFLRLLNIKTIKAVAPVLAVFFFLSCDTDILIDMKKNEPQLVVEGYINNYLSEYNYVILSKSMDYFAPDFQSVAVSNALVYITEGTKNADNSYTWNPATRVQLTETDNTRVPTEYRKGLYVDSRMLMTSSVASSQSLRGRTGKHYLLEITVEGKNYSAITSLLTPVTLDSLSSGYSFTDTEDQNKMKARLTVNYKDPDTLGNRQLFYWRQKKNMNSFGWGALSSNRRLNGTDDLYNGQYVKLTQPQGFEYKDSVEYYMISVDRTVYRFWDSYNKARNNDGPFSTPVQLISNIEGTNVTGCFSGFSVSAKKIVVHP
jgi:hypothetical protein